MGMLVNRLAVWAKDSHKPVGACRHLPVSTVFWWLLDPTWLIY
jgi:hypothetical protein